MNNIENLISDLNNRDNRIACDCCKRLVNESASNGEIYKYFNVFVPMLESENSLVRNRAISLIAACAKWDSENKIDNVIDAFLTHISDEKPITSRQCIKALPEIAKYKQHLKPIIINALEHATPEKYNESMKPLVTSDIKTALAQIK